MKLTYENQDYPDCRVPDWNMKLPDQWEKKIAEHNAKKAAKKGRSPKPSERAE